MDFASFSTPENKIFSLFLSPNSNKYFVTTSHYHIVFFCFVFLILKKKLFKLSNLSPSYVCSIFILKFILVSSFVFYLEKHPEYDLKGDHEYYLNDARVLNRVFYRDPVIYFKLLTGFDNSETTKEKYLTETRLWNNPTKKYNDCRTVARIHSVVVFVSAGNEYIHLLFATLLSTYTILLFFLAFSKYISNPNIFILFLGLFPSLLIYGGLVMKEHLLFFGIASFLYGIRQQRLNSLHLWLGLFLLFTVKIYIFYAIALSVLFYFLIKSAKKYTSKVFIILSFILLLAGILFSSFGDNIVNRISNQQYAFRNVATKGIYLYDPADKNRSFFYYLNIKDTTFFRQTATHQLLLEQDIRALKVKQAGTQSTQPVLLKQNQLFDIAMIVRKASQSYVQPYYLNYDKKRLIVSIPSSIYHCLFQPDFKTPGSNAKYPAIAETLLMTTFAIFSLLYALGKHRKKFNDPLVISLLFFIFLSAFIVGITTPVVGAMVRYRIPTYIALVILSFILIDPIWKKKSHLSQEQHPE